MSRNRPVPSPRNVAPLALAGAVLVVLAIAIVCWRFMSADDGAADDPPASLPPAVAQQDAGCAAGNGLELAAKFSRSVGLEIPDVLVSRSPEKKAQNARFGPAESAACPGQGAFLGLEQ